MPNLFTPRADRRLRWAVALGLGLLLGAPVTLMIYMRTPFVTEVGATPVQPVAFDHRHHVRDDGIDCLYCHDGADRSAHAGIPPTEVCMGCHSQIHLHDPLLEPVRRSRFEQRPIAWQRVHDLPDFVFFDHSIHVTRGIECARCHGAVEDMGWVRKVYPMNMGWCLDCHDPRPLEPEREVDVDLDDRVAGIAGDPRGPSHCTACHR